MPNHISNGVFETNTATGSAQNPSGWTATEGSPDLNTDGNFEWSGSYMPSDLDASDGGGYITMYSTSAYDEGLSTTLGTQVQAGQTYTFSFDYYVNESDGSTNQPGATDLIVTIGTQTITVPIDSTGATAPYWQSTSVTFTATETTSDFAIGTSTDGGSLNYTGIALDNLDLDVAPDYVVEGTGGNDVIDVAYVGDPEGDMIDANDHSDGSDADSVLAGAGDDSVVSGAGNDTVFGADGSDTILGGAGDDNLDGDDVFATGGADSIDGGAGNDQIIGDVGNDTLIGGTGNDTIYAGDDDDLVEGDGGDDQIFGEAGDDTVYGGAGADSVIGGSGNDIIDGQGDDDTLRGGTGNDTIDGGVGNDSLHGNEDDDSITGGAGADSIYGETGNDIVSGDGGNDTVEGGSGDDTISGGAGDDFLRGSFGNDSLTSDAGDDSLWGGYGDDTFSYTDGFGNDTIEGEEANETDGDTLDLSGVTSDLTVDLTSANPEAGSFTDGTATTSFVEIENIVLGGGNDTLVLGTGGGNDSVQGFTIPTDNGDGTYTANDQLDVSTLTDANGAPVNTDDVTVTDDGNGNAVLTFPGGETLTLVGVAPADVSDPDILETMGVPQPDYVVEGTGAGELIDGSYLGDPEGDVIDGSDDASGGNTDSVVAGGGDDTVFSYVGNDTVDGGAGNDSVDGGSGDDALIGGAGNDTLQGWFDDDSLTGGVGDDSLVGWTGNDTLEGGAGDDSIAGGDDQDLIILEDGFGTDTIDGGDGGAVDDDTLDMSAVTTDTTIDLTGANPEAGTVTSGTDSATFGDIENIVLGSGTDTIVLADGSGADTVEGFAAPSDNGDGTFTGNDQIDVSGMTDAGGNPVNVSDVTVTDTNGDGTGDAVLTFPGGESITLVGVSPDEVDSHAELEALGIPGLDYVVEGTGGNDVIDGTYTGDPEGDMVDAGDNAAGGDDDSIEAGAGNDTIVAGLGNDTVRADEGDDSVEGGSGDDSIYGFEGSDTVFGGDGDDWINTRTSPGTGLPDEGYTDTSGTGLSYPGDTDTGNDRDSVDGGTGNDVILTGDDDDTVLGGSGDDTVNAGFDDDDIDGGSGADSLEGGEGEDTIDGGADNDLIYGDVSPDNPNVGTYTPYELPNDGTDDAPGNNADSLSGGDGDDSIYGQDDNDTLAGGAGDDLLDGGLDDDLLTGGAGSDTLDGGAGNDTLVTSSGDSAQGGDGDDLFTIDDALTDGTAIGITGGEGDETLGDTLDFQGLVHWDDVTYTNTDPGVGGGLSGTATLGDGTIVNFDEIENVIICFTAGTRIATPRGAREVETLAPGDLVITRDNGLQPIRWVGKRTVPALGTLAPVTFAPGVLGNERELRVSPQHRMLLQGPEASLLFGESEVLATAKHLVNAGTVTQTPGGEITYVHILFDQHEIVYAEGAPSESFFPGGEGLGAVEDAAREELFTLFPELRSHAGAFGETARLCLKAYESELMGLG
ncbi:hypothetical protein DZK27_12985 [Rhodobacteraceae bacterium 63075]|nr:hypothetical protein DZK27_12985 [Rhodobacteraceae bacterium 63075]